MYNLSFINDRIRKGDTTKIADRSGYSVSHVSNVLASRRTNDSILKEAYKVTYRRKANA